MKEGTEEASKSVDEAKQVVGQTNDVKAKEKS
jgi:hypothetical protein